MTLLWYLLNFKLLCMLMIVVFFLNGESPSDLIKIANQDLKQIIRWLNINKLSLNIKKS